MTSGFIAMSERKLFKNVHIFTMLFHLCFLLLTLNTCFHKGQMFSNVMRLTLLSGLEDFDGIHNYPSKKAMAPHSSTFAWKIPRMEEPGRL